MTLGWRRALINKPTAPVEPKKPTRSDYEREFIIVQTYNIQEDIPLELIDNNCEIVVKLEVEYNYEDSDTYRLHVGRYADEREIGDLMANGMRLYHRQMEDYRKKMNQYEKDLAAYEEQQKGQLSRELKAAEKLLREHGRLK